MSDVAVTKLFPFPSTYVNSFSVLTIVIKRGKKRSEIDAEFCLIWTIRNIPELIGEKSSISFKIHTSIKILILVFCNYLPKFIIFIIYLLF